MATTTYYTLQSRDRDARDPRAPARIDRILSLGSLILLGFALAAIVRGAPHWREVPAIIWLHLATILTATALTPVMLLRRRGDRRHRMLGAVWLTAMFATALLSMFIRTSGGFSVIHNCRCGRWRRCR